MYLPRKGVVSLQSYEPKQRRQLEVYFFQFPLIHLPPPQEYNNKERGRVSTYDYTKSEMPPSLMYSRVSTYYTKSEMPPSLMYSRVSTYYTKSEMPPSLMYSRVSTYYTKSEMPPSLMYSRVSTYVSVLYQIRNAPFTYMCTS